MFRMTGNIYLADTIKDLDDKTKTIVAKANSLKWENSVSNYCNTAEIILPHMCAKKESRVAIAYTHLPTGLVFTSGKAIRIECGYNGRNHLRFIGFITKTKETKDKRLSILCEGFSYQLRNKQFQCSLKNPTLKELLLLLTEKTDIKLSPKIPHVTLFGTVRFAEGKRGINVLEYLKDKCGLTPFFQHNVLYVGLKFVLKGKDVKYKIGWNTINSDTLEYKEPALYNVIIRANKKDGSKTIITTGEGTQVKVTIDHIKDQSFLEEIANDKHLLLNKGSYAGSIETLMEPFVEPTDSAILKDSDGYESRNGTYFVDSVKGSFSINGGRQTVGISIRLS